MVKSRICQKVLTFSLIQLLVHKGLHNTACSQSTFGTVFRSVRFQSFLAMAFSKAKKEQIDELLDNADVHAEIKTYLFDTIGVKSVDNFHGLVTVAGYELELNTQILAKTTQKDSLIELTHLRAAWRAADLRIKDQTKLFANHATADLDEPLDSGTHDTLKSSFTAKYSIRFSIYLYPADTLLGRLYRESQRTTQTVISISKCKSLFTASMPKVGQDVLLGQNIRMQLNNVDDQHTIANVYEYFCGLRILGHAQAIIGQGLVDSLESPGSKVVASPLDVNIDYADCCLRRVMEAGLSQQDQLPWLQTKDEYTRAKCVELQRQSWPHGEALLKALRDTEVFWSTHTGNRKRTAEQDGGSPSQKKVRTGTMWSGQAICKRWNDQRGCANKCPDHKVHCCDALKPDGDVCGSTSHARSDCRHFKASS